MEISDKFKKFIFKKLYKDLSNVEIIPYKDSIWFIDRENEHWYFEYEKSGTLWWRYYFFEDFFKLFSLESNVYQSIISEWVEEVLNHKVETTYLLQQGERCQVEEVLNHKVETTQWSAIPGAFQVEEVLNCKVETTLPVSRFQIELVEEVLNCKVETTKRLHLVTRKRVEEVLNCKVLKGNN